MSQHTRFVARTGDALLATAWQGPVLLDAERGPRWVHGWSADDETIVTDIMT